MKNHGKSMFLAGVILSLAILPRSSLLGQTTLLRDSLTEIGIYQME